MLLTFYLCNFKVFSPIAPAYLHISICIFSCFSCIKQLVLLLDTANWRVMPYYFNVLSYEHAVVQTVYFVFFAVNSISLQRLMNWKSRTFTENGLLPCGKIRWILDGIAVEL